ncbi:uncharacterized protein LOC119369245 [Jatropha curcas]|uniref:uncharacterized protein LOC119369245 n=1 Tax=Jatropha curcas TaxID=180498 RepID=UPI0018943714|nr:uncharacterized protein LOC119369245 [Jatropha curcas]
MSMKKLRKWKDATVELQSRHQIPLHGSFNISTWGMVNLTGWQSFVDGAVFMDLHMVGFGCVFELAEGNFVQALSGFFDLCTDPLLVGALALCTCLTWLHYHHLSPRNLLSSRPNMAIRWITRQANIGAHILAGAFYSHALSRCGTLYHIVYFTFISNASLFEIATDLIVNYNKCALSNIIPLKV